MDYLELNFEFELATFKGKKEYIDLTPNVYIEFTGNQSSTFHNIDNLYIDQRLIGQVKYNSKIQPEKEMVLLKIENSLLYSNTFTTYITHLIEVVGFKLNHISRIDISHDATHQNVIGFLNGYIKNRMSKSPNITMKGKPQINSMYFDNETNQYKTFTIGSLISGKQVKIYNKTEELKTSKKNYIKEFWKDNGLTYEGNTVERTELTLLTPKSKYINYKQLQDPNYLSSICQMEFKNYFEFTKTITNQYGTTIKDITPVNFDDYTLQTLTKPKREKPSTHTSIKTIKTVIKTLFMENLTEDEPDNSPIIKLTSKYNLRSWYDEKQPYWNEDFMRKNHIKIMKEKEINEIIDQMF